MQSAVGKQPEDGTITQAQIAADKAAPAWFKKCYFQITPDPAKAAPDKGFRISRVTLL